MELLLVAAVIIGAFAQGATGIGFGLVVAPICALVLDPGDVVGTVARLGLVVDVGLVVQGRSHVDVRVSRNYLVPALLAVPCAVFVVGVVTDTTIVVAVSVLTLVGAMTLLLARPVPPEAVVSGSATLQYVAGFAAGFMGVTAGMPGPPVAVEASRRHASPAQTRATLAVLFVVVDAAATIANPRSVPLLTTAALAIAAVVGLAAGCRAAVRLHGPALQRVLGALIVASALAALVRTHF